MSFHGVTVWDVVDFVFTLAMYAIAQVVHGIEVLRSFGS